MSRVGKKPVPVPAGASVAIDGRTIKAKGPKGELTFVTHDLVEVAMGEEGVQVTPKNETKQARALWGTTRAQIANMVTGVTQGYERTLELVGVGYRAQMKGQMLSMALGYSHDVDFNPPSGITIAVPKPTEIKIAGIDKQAVGQVAAVVRGYRPPEPYKGKGVKYQGETIRRKEGKKK
jgi:large subunit ribosomal protein L6